MKYCEIIIGPPGSGKSTYIQYKAEKLQNRNLYVMNLDPGNEITEGFDYSICSISNTKNYQIQCDYGPNMSVKSILQKFSNHFSTFYNENLENNDYYLIIDFPGQIEFFMCEKSLDTIIQHLKKNDYMVVVINLIDSVFFTNPRSLLSSYLISTICVGLIEAPQICVISKCDNFNKLNHEYSLKDIADLQVLEDFPNKDKFSAEIVSFVKNQSFLLFEILDYTNENTMNYLQISIDRITGYLFDDDYFSNEKITKIPNRDEIFDFYEKEE